MRNEDRITQDLEAADGESDLGGEGGREGGREGGSEGVPLGGTAVQIAFSRCWRWPRAPSCWLCQY